MIAPYEKRSSDFYFRSDGKNNISLSCGYHLHYHVEIAYIEEGSFKAHVDSECYTLGPSDMLVVFPNRIHRFEAMMPNEKYKLFIINPELVPELLHKIRHETPKSAKIQHANKNPRLMSLIKILSETEKIKFPQGEMSRDIVMKGYLLSFFGEILGMMNLSKTRSEDSHAMRMILDYCTQNFTQGLTLTSLQEELHLSKYYISHLFGDKLGISFNEYINSLRISEACRHLRFSEYSITEIAAISGFGTLRTFNRAFSKQMNMSPSDYRKGKTNENNSASVLG